MNNIFSVCGRHTTTFKENGNNYVENKKEMLEMILMTTILFYFITDVQH